MSLKPLNYFKEKENLNGKKDIALILDCSHCSEKEKNFFHSKKCLHCFLKVLFKNRNRKFDYGTILGNEAVINIVQSNLFLNYFKLIKTLKRINNKIEKLRSHKCKYKEFKCKIFPELFSLYKIKEQEYYDPIYIYTNSLKRLSCIQRKPIKDSICEECNIFVENSIKYILKTLSNLEIIKLFKNFNIDKANLTRISSFYEFLFSSNSIVLNNKSPHYGSSSNINKRLIDSYLVGNYNEYTVKIFKNSGENEKQYQIDPFYKEEQKKDCSELLIQDLSTSIDITEIDQIVPLEKLIEFYEEETLKILNSKYKLSVENTKRICILSAIKKLNLDKLFPLLIDDLIEEIFLDSPKDKIYINHQTYNRCRTDIEFSSKEIDRIKSLIRLYSGQRLDFRNPSIKFVIKNKFFYCRFSIDVDPIQINNFALDIRKLNKNILTIQDLLKNGTMNPLIAAFLYFNIIRRKNITVTGETDTGKTTLINAMDLLVPKEYRKIYVENITESLDQFKFGKHQLKYKVDSLEEPLIEKYSKSNQIKTLLHRTPDLIYLGEILTKEEAEAMFQCLAAGLRGFQTLHSRNIDSLLNRFIHHFNINRSCLNDLDLIVLMKKLGNERKIIGLYEIYKSYTLEDSLFQSIFEYNPNTTNWDLNKTLYETNVVQSIKKYEDLTEQSFGLFIEIYKEIFEYLLKLIKIDNIELIDFFHKISYYSSRSIVKLKQFWNYWKKSRSLNL